MKIMNKLVMVVWGLTIFALCTLVLMIGYKHKDKEDDLSGLQSNLKQAVQMYMKDHNINLGLSESTKVYIDDLVEEEYINKGEDIDKYCIDNVVYSNGIFKDSVTLNRNCEE